MNEERENADGVAKEYAENRKRSLNLETERFRYSELLLELQTKLHNGPHAIKIAEASKLFKEIENYLKRFHEIDKKNSELRTLMHKHGLGDLVR